MKTLLALAAVLLLTTGCLPRCDAKAETLAIGVIPRGQQAVTRMEWRLTRHCGGGENGREALMTCTIRQARGEATDWEGQCREAALVPTLADISVGAASIINWDPLQGDICVRGTAVLLDGRVVELPPRTIHLRERGIIAEYHLVDGRIEPPANTTDGCATP